MASELRYGALTATQAGPPTHNQTAHIRTLSPQTGRGATSLPLRGKTTLEVVLSPGAECGGYRSTERRLTFATSAIKLFHRRKRGTMTRPS